MKYQLFILLVSFVTVLTGCKSSLPREQSSLNTVDHKEYNEDYEFTKYHITGFWKRTSLLEGGEEVDKFIYVKCKEVTLDFHEDLAVEKDEERSETLELIAAAENHYKEFKGEDYPLPQIAKNSQGLCSFKEQELTVDQMAVVTSYLTEWREKLAPISTVDNYKHACGAIVIGGVYANLAWFGIMYHQMNSESSTCNKLQRYKKLRRYFDDHLLDVAVQLEEEVPNVVEGSNISDTTRVTRLSFDAVQKVLDDAVSVSLDEEALYDDPTAELDETQQMQRR